jgi:SAM-dependent methyltransferase
VVDLGEPDRPLIRHVSPALDRQRRWYVGETQAFFGARAATWDARFGDEAEAYAAAVGEAGFASGGAVIDVGCGTGRALPAVRAVVGPAGTVIGVDLTPEMLAAARAGRRDARATLVLADARRLPLADASVDAAFAAGFLPHLPDPVDGLRELARVTRSGGRLAVFHPVGRAALAARHGRVPSDDDTLAPPTLRPLLVRTGWLPGPIDDGPDRYLALATRAADGS